MWGDDGVLHPTPRIIGDPNAISDIKIIFPADAPFAGKEIIPTLKSLIAMTDEIINNMADIITN